MTRRLSRCFFMIIGIAAIISGCKGRTTEQAQASETSADAQAEPDTKCLNLISPTAEITELKSGFSAVRFDGDYGLDLFLEQGGASSDAEVIGFLTENLLPDISLGDIIGGVFGCSTIAVKDSDSSALFGRNFDWQSCEAMVVEAYPKNGYASISTVNMDFITQSAGGIVGLALNMDEVKTLAALYAPLDGMNEAGLAVSVNMILDSETINQNTDKPDITTTTAIRLLLDRAGSVEEATALLEQYDLHSSMGMMIHFAIADSTGESVAVEYINNEMIVSKTPVLTNFYVSEGEKQGIGTQQSHERYDILMSRLSDTPEMSMEDVKNAVDSVSKDNFGGLESTEWSVVMNLSDGEARYYHREDYSRDYTFRLDG